MAGPLVILLPLPPKECWPNWTGKLRERIRAKREARLWAYYAARDALPRTPDLCPLGTRWRATAAYTFHVRRVRDDDGLVGALKHYRDGIAAALGGDDAGWRWESVTATVDKGAPEGVTITVLPVADGTESDGEGAR